jgi:hypothetical protein
MLSVIAVSADEVEEAGRAAWELSSHAREAGHVAERTGHDDVATLLYIAAAVAFVLAFVAFVVTR